MHNDDSTGMAAAELEIQRQIAELAACARKSGWSPLPNLRMTGSEVMPSNRGKGPGQSLYVHTVAGISFEAPIHPGNESHDAIHCHTATA